MSVTRSGLVGKRVYDQEAKFVGEVQDIALKLEGKDITLIVKVSKDKKLEIPWDKVAAVRDIVLLKEKIELPQEALQQPAPPAPQNLLSQISSFFRRERKTCPNCGKPATWIPKYQRWYCYNCRMYIE
jgi:sporulation protein YlmC with PRC-barrel domain/ribosomal protein S27AE